MNNRNLSSIQKIAERVFACFVFALHLAAASANGPKLNPVKWTLATDSKTVAPGSTVVFHLRAEIAEGYHLYSLTTPPGGPIPTTISLPDQAGLQKVVVFQATPDRHNDATLGVPVETFTGTADFPIQADVALTAASQPWNIVAKVRYQACSDEICLPPVERNAVASLAINSNLTATHASVPGNFLPVDKAAPRKGVLPASVRPSEASLDLGFLLLAFGFGLAAIFTPCVFPSIPLTISYFLQNQKSGRQAAVVQSLLFATGIVVLFSLTGVLITLIAGPFGVVQAASNPWVNGFVAFVFLALGLSLLGAFELTLPSSLLTRFDGLSRKGGVVGGLMLGFTFCLTSFACIGPFLGKLTSRVCARLFVAPGLRHGGLQHRTGNAFLCAFSISLFLEPPAQEWRVAVASKGCPWVRSFGCGSEIPVQRRPGSPASSPHS